MRKKRLYGFSLAIGLSALFITPQIDSPINASAQNARVKQDGFIIGCSETVIDALDECVQKRFGKVDLLFGFDRMEPPSRHINYFLAETENEREAISELEKGGWQVAFYLVGRRILGPKPDLTKPDWRYLGEKASIINGPLALTSPAAFDGWERDAAKDYRMGPIATISSINFDKKKMIDQFELPEPLKIWDDARKAMLEFEKKDQYEFSFGKWSVAARPIRAQESCLKCHSVNVTTDPSATPPKVGDPLGVAMYAYARKQKITSTLK